jgi:hypothetical protein
MSPIGPELHNTLDLAKSVLGGRPDMASAYLERRL